MDEKSEKPLVRFELNGTAVHPRGKHVSFGVMQRRHKTLSTLFIVPSDHLSGKWLGLGQATMILRGRDATDGHLQSGLWIIVFGN